MRIISQSGADFPYDLMAISLGWTGDEIGYKIFGRFVCFEQKKPIELATYSTLEKAEKAMDMLHIAYCEIYNVKMKGEYTEEDVEKFKEAMRNAPILDANRNLGQVECKIFQFPKDEEIEVDE